MQHENKIQGHQSLKEYQVAHPILRKQFDLISFSNCYIGICPQGNFVCHRKQPKEEERLKLICHDESGLIVIIIPHWHWQRGAPVCFRGAGKRNSKLWDCETRFLMDLSKTKHWENPMRSLRVGYGDQKDNSKTSGSRVCQFQVVWRHPMKEHTRKQGPTPTICDESAGILNSAQATRGLPLLSSQDSS